MECTFTKTVKWINCVISPGRPTGKRKNSRHSWVLEKVQIQELKEQTWRYLPHGFHYCLIISSLCTMFLWGHGPISLLLNKLQVAHLIFISHIFILLILMDLRGLFFSDFLKCSDFQFSIYVYKMSLQIEMRVRLWCLMDH